MGTKRVAISMVEGLFLFLVLETLGKLSGFCRVRAERRSLAQKCC